MACNRRIIEASPQAVFDVLADPRGYAYWVIGSAEIREADDDWPAEGSRFHHSIRVGPVKVQDHTRVEEARPPDFLQLKAKARPLGTARVKLELEPVDGGTQVTMTENPADRATAFLFMPLTHFLTWGRNVRSLDRLAELAEGRKPMPGDEPDAAVRTLDGAGAVSNPQARDRRDEGVSTIRAVGKGAAAGLCAAAVMTVSTNVEMRLRGRGPSYAPAKALGRVLGVRTRGKRRKMALGAAGHVAISVSVGILRGILDRFGVGPRAAAPTLFAIAMTPDLVVVPALGASDPPWEWSAADFAVSALHHGLFAATVTIVYDRLDAKR